MKKLLPLAFTFILAGCSEVNSVTPFDHKQAALILQQNYVSQPAEQMVKLDLPRNNQWKKIDLSFTNKGAPAMLVPKNETEDHWTQSIRTKINAYINTPGITAKQVVQADLNHARENCKEASGAIISETRDSIVYQLNFANCANEKNQTQIGKAFNGKDAVYLVRYAAIDCKVQPTDVANMSRIIKQAQLVHDPRYISHS